MLRKTLERLNKNNLLLESNVEVDHVYEMGAVLKYFDNRMPMLFNKVKGHSMPVAGALYGDREILYDLLQTTREDRIYKFMDSIANPKPYKVVKNGPVKENIISRNIDLEKFMPINRFHEKN